MADLIRFVRLASKNAPDAPTLNDIARATDVYIAECSTSPDFEKLILSLEEELQVVHRDIVDYTFPCQLEVFLVVLLHLKLYLTLESMFHWWEIIIRPALREPKLGAVAISHAKELVLAILRRKTGEESFKKIRSFRRQLFDLYLLDALNNGLGNILELDIDERDRRSHWKANLEDILLTHGKECPQDFMTEVHDLFAVPSSRIQLLMLLNIYVSSSSFITLAVAMANHPVTTRLLTSMLLDNCPTACSSGLTMITKLLPMLAAVAPEALRTLLPMLLAILARLLCWKERQPTSFAPDTVTDQELVEKNSAVAQPCPNSNWECLEATFDGTASILPFLRPYFSTLYYLYPANLLSFLRFPAKYLRDSVVANPWTGTWEQALNQDEIRTCSEPLLREHLCHPAFLWQAGDSPLPDVEFWAQYSVARIATEALMLDARNFAPVVIERRTHTVQDASPRTELPISLTDVKVDQLADTPPLDMAPIKTTRSMSPPEISKSAATRSTSSPTQKSDKPKRSPALVQPNLTPASNDPFKSLAFKNDGIPPHYLQLVARLQHEVLLLHNELNLELWLSRENVKHISRLFLDRSTVKSAEAERQGLYNKLRKYRAQVVQLDSELHEYKAQASSTKNKYAEWNTELQKKLKDLREEKKSWLSECATLRRAHNDCKSLLITQEKLLEEANKKIFASETWKKENQHKIDRLHDYEEQIAQHIKMQQLWDQDFARFNERGDQVSVMQSHFKQMELRLESHEKTQVEMDAQIRAYRRQIQTLEARLSQMRRKTESLRHPIEQEIASIATERATLLKANQKLRDENVRLREENDELRAVVEVNMEVVRK